MAAVDPAMLEAAALWVARSRDSSFRDWDALLTWLEADPGHNDAYEMTLDAHDIAGHLEERRALSSHEATMDPVATLRGAWRPIWITVAAAGLAAAIGMPLLLSRQHPSVITTKPGEQRSITLPDGTQVVLNGGSRMIVDRAHPRMVTLAAGEASFTVVHDAASPFSVKAGDRRIEDVGTVFDVVRSESATDVAVSEGMVVYDPDGAKVKLVAGRTLHDPDDGTIEVAQADPAAIGAWRDGRLVYRGAPLSVVVADLSRATGYAIALAPGHNVGTFSGTIVFRGLNQKQLIERLGALTGMHAVRSRRGWLLAAGTGASR